MAKRKAKELYPPEPVPSAYDRQLEKEEQKRQTLLRILKKRFREKLSEHQDKPELAIILQNIHDYQELKVKKAKQAELSAVYTPLFLTITMLLSGRTSAEILQLTVVLEGLVTLLSLIRFVDTANSAEKELKAILSELDRLGFSPWVGGLTLQKTIWGNTIKDEQILETLLETVDELAKEFEKTFYQLKTAHDNLADNEENISLSEILDRRHSTNYQQNR